MSFFMIPGLSLVLILVLAAASLPWIAAAENGYAKKVRRSLFHKSAYQLTQIAFILQLLLFLALGADIFMGGIIVRYAAGPLQLPFLLAVLSFGGAAVFSLLSLVLVRKKKQSGSQGFLVLSGMFAAAAAAVWVLLSWVFLRGAYLEPAVVAHPDIVELARSMSRMEKPVIPALFGAMCLVLSLVCGFAFGLMWYVLRRNRADYGRDYYNTVLTRMGRMEAKVSGLLLLPLVVILFSLTQDFSLGRLPFILPGEPQQTMLVLSILTLCLPVAVICWQMFTRAEVPMRRKSLLFIAPVFLALWFFAQIGKLWL